MKRIITLWFLLSILGVACVLWALRKEPAPSPDVIAINDIVMNAVQNNDTSEAARLMTARLTQAYQDMDAARQDRDAKLRFLICTLVVVFTAAGIGLCLYCDRSVLRPFRDLRQFAKNVAAGNLEFPLTMDRHGSFGAFTESFDLMRVKLSMARESERAANRSKKELVASLSHDIKTPVASIKAVAELMLLKSPDNAGPLGVILSKADQIDLLITNMFHATLEELEQLTVTPAELPSTILYDIIQNADYNHKVKEVNIPECIVTADKIQLQQVFDNIVSNSYKYAGTDIEVAAYFEDTYLAVEMRDTGTGVPSGELPLIFEKFYRGGNAIGKSGAGLGLYISKHLMGKMDGDIQCLQNQNGFTVKVLLAL